MTEQIHKLPVFPVTAEISPNGSLFIGGCEVAGLAREFGTPLYIYDELTLREKCREFKTEFVGRHPTTVNYSCKAFLNRAVLKIFIDEGLGLDVVSGGEIAIATAFGFPPGRIDFPGNNKSADELALALELGVRHIVVDNFHELEMLGAMTRISGRRQAILLRLSPGIDPHTHRFITTGNLDSKFGIPLSQGEAAVRAALDTPGVSLTGLHFHLGSQLTDVNVYAEALRIIIRFAAGMTRQHGFELKELSVGGGYAQYYLPDEPVPLLKNYAETIIRTLKDACREEGIAEPDLIIEPGRSMVAGAGVAVYTAGVIKDIPGVRKYVSVDGGMGDNVCPPLYNERIEAVLANRMKTPNSELVTICGKYCESTDVLVRDIEMPVISPGDIIVVPGCGAYCLMESMNYNAALRPAVVMVADGKARLIRRRETIEDLMRCETE